MNHQITGILRLNRPFLPDIFRGVLVLILLFSLVFFSIPAEAADWREVHGG